MTETPVAVVNVDQDATSGFGEPLGGTGFDLTNTPEDETAPQQEEAPGDNPE